jgi:hypothetical protein
LFQLVERGKRAEPGVYFMAQKLKLTTREMGLGIPEQTVFGGELRRELGLKSIDLTAKLPVYISSNPQLATRLFDFATYLLKRGPGLAASPLDLGLRCRDQTLCVSF